MRRALWVSFRARGRRVNTTAQRGASNAGRCRCWARGAEVLGQLDSDKREGRQTACGGAASRDDALREEVAEQRPVDPGGGRERRHSCVHRLPTADMTPPTKYRRACENNSRNRHWPEERGAHRRAVVDRHPRAMALHLAAHNVRDAHRERERARKPVEPEHLRIRQPHGAARHKDIRGEDSTHAAGARGVWRNIWRKRSTRGGPRRANPPCSRAFDVRRARPNETDNSGVTTAFATTSRVASAEPECAHHRTIVKRLPP